MTFFSVFDVPVFWPILLLYWCVLFAVTMKRQIQHMIRYRYLPFTWGKKVRQKREEERDPSPSHVCGVLSAEEAELHLHHVR